MTSHLPIFATPVSMYELSGMEDVNRELTERLVAESTRVPSVHRSNVGSWHSPNLAGRPEAPFRTLIEAIVTHVRETVDRIARERSETVPRLRAGVHAWAMVMRNGDYTIPHDHADAHWASVYYADMGDVEPSQDSESGVLAFLDPRHGARPMPGLDLLGGTFTVAPRTGRLVIFPGWLLHYVHAYHGARPRVSISCNVVFDIAPPTSH